MKKMLSILGILILIALPCYAQNRGSFTNYYASFTSVTANTNYTFNLPSNSRDVLIINDSGNKICVSPGGATINFNSLTGYCQTSDLKGILQMNTATSVQLFDYITNAITVRNTGSTAASPISIIVTY